MENIIPCQLAADVGKYHLALTLLLNRPEARNLGSANLEFMNYNEANRRVSSMAAQMYRLEMMFPPEIAFMGGIIEGGNPELIEDLSGRNSITNIAMLNFTHTPENDTIVQRVLGTVPEEMLFAIGYAQGVKEENPQLNHLGYNGYMCSVITDHNFRLVNGIGRKMVEPILNQMDSLGNSYLTTWVDTGRTRNRVNLSHYPGMGFWFNQHFDPLNMEQAKKVINGVRGKHEAAGISGRRYELEKVTPEQINHRLYQDNFARRLGNPGSRAAGFIQRRTEPFAVIPEHYENGWTGIIMARYPQQIQERNLNPEKYGNPQWEFEGGVNIWRS